MLAPLAPEVHAAWVEWVHGHIADPLHKVFGLGAGLRHDDVDVHFEFLAVGFEGQIVDVHAEGVFDFTTDGGEAEDDVAGEDAAGDGDPAEILPELEGQHHNVNPGNLGDGDGVGDGEGGLEDTVDADEHFVELDDHVDGLVLIETNFHGVVFDEAVDIGRNMGENLERQVSQRLLRLLDSLAGIGLSEGNTKVFANRFHLAIFLWLRDIGLGSFGESVQVCNAFSETVIFDSWLESDLVHDSAGVGDDQVEGRAKWIC